MVSGIGVSGLKLTLNGGQELTVTSAGAFTFPTPLPNGSSYSVQVSQNPTAPPQASVLTGNTGVIAGANVTDVSVICSALTLTITNVTDTAPGSAPTVAFLASQNGVPLNILATPLAALRATISGPTTDYARYWQVRIQGSGATGTLSAIDAAAGSFQYTFATPIPADASGSYALALDGYFLNGSYPGLRFSAISPVRFFPVTDATAVARRTVVNDAKCYGCHTTITAHGGIVRGVQYCAFCHNGNLSNDTQVARFEAGSIVAPSMDMKVLIHKIHRGRALVQQPYVIGGFPAPSPANPGGTPIAYGTVVYPGDPRDCKACHLPGTDTLPLVPGMLPATTRTWTSTEPPSDDPNDYSNTPFFIQTDTVRTPPQAAVCTSCHDAPYTAAHAATMTTLAGVESCQTCHGTGAAYGIERNHTLSR
jgi:OmcA/MtrC family decaheme c-type cytochrome